MSILKHLANEFVKNIKIMFRNWTSISLLIIAPLVFILLVGYAFSSEEITGVNIGVVSEEDVDLMALAENISDFGTLEEYDSISECQIDMKLQKIHICVGLEGSIKEEGRKGSAPEKVVYYYDNSRRRVSLELISKIQEFFGLKAEQISIENAEAIIGDIRNLIDFIDERRQDIKEVKNESINIKSKLIERREKLEDLRADFLPSYFIIKDLQEDLHNKSTAFDNRSEKLIDTINRLQLTLDSFKKTTDDPATLLLVGELETQLDEMSNLTNSTNSDINLLVLTIDNTVGKIDVIKGVLDEEIELNDRLIEDIDKSIVKIDEIDKELDEQLFSLSKLSPGAAEKLIKPIVYEYDLLLKGISGIQLSFPRLLAVIIMFISLLFANTSTLMEIHNKAYFRNIIAPVNDIIYSAGMLLTGTVVVFFQIIVLFIVAQANLGINISSIFWQLSLISVLLVMVFILIGMIFAYLFKSVQTSILVTTFSALIFFMFSDAFTPLEAMPGFARLLSSFNPLVVGEFLFKQVQLFEIPIAIILPKILLLFIYVDVLFIIVAILSKNVNKKRK